MLKDARVGHSQEQHVTHRLWSGLRLHGAGTMDPVPIGVPAGDRVQDTILEHPVAEERSAATTAGHECKGVYRGGEN